MRKTLIGILLFAPLLFLYGQHRPSGQATSGQVLTWNGSAWVAGDASAPPPASLAGDVIGTTTATVVGALRGKAVNPVAPTSGQTLTFDGTQWTPTTPAASAGGGVVAAGTITVSGATTATHNFPTALPSGAVCQTSPTFDPVVLPSLTWWATNTTSSVTVNLNSTGSGTFNFICTAPRN
jgi:hypothetical protein